MATTPQPPIKTGGPPDSWPHRALYERVIAALHALPARFASSLVIEGVPATDLFTMNTPLGAAIEISVVDSMNALRDVWDPENDYASYAFVRQGQTFPDVLLRTDDPSAAERVLMGIELKGWFAIAKEGEPSYRYLAAAGACAPADLLVVVPWIFDSVVSGKPKLLQPIITLKPGTRLRCVTTIGSSSADRTSRSSNAASTSPGTLARTRRRVSNTWINRSSIAAAISDALRVAA